MALAGPVAAEGAALCGAVWARATEGLTVFGALRAGAVGQDGDWCVAEAVVLDLQGQYLPDWHMDRLRFRGSALGWLAEGMGLPEGLEVAVDGLHFVIQTGQAQTDWLLAAQARAQKIRAEAALSWDAGARVLRLEGLSVDFPGENLVDASAVVTGVDLSSTGALQMSAGSFALTEAELRVRSHGLFEAYLLMALGTALLPPEGDMEAAAEALRTDLRAAVAGLPDAMVGAGSRAALAALVGELPNPSGELTLSLRAEPGLGPARLAGPALTGMPASLADVAPLVQGVTVEVGWTHADTP